MHLGRLALHAEGQLERRDPRLEVAVRTVLRRAAMLHLRDQVELQPLEVAPGVAVANERNLGLLRPHAGVAQRRPLIHGGQEARAEVVGPPLREVLADRDVSREVLVLAPEPIRDPRAHARPDERVAARVPFQHGTAVPRVGAVHRIDDAEFVGAARPASGITS